MSADAKRLSERVYSGDDEQQVPVSGRFKCPHCSHQLEFDGEELPWDDGDEKELECHLCESFFQIRAVASVEHYICKPDESEAP